MQSKTGVSWILCAVLIGIFGCDKFSDRSINNQVVDSTQTTNLVKAKLSKGSNSKTIPEEVSRTQAQSQVLKDSNADPAKVEPIISEKSDQKHLKQGGSFSTQAEEEPKAITKKQAHDFCHSDWVKQHYSCKEGISCNDTQEVVTDDLDYQCKILSPEQNLAVILKLVNTTYDHGTYQDIYYTVIIDLVDTKTPRVLDRFKGKENYIDYRFFSRAYLKIFSSSRDLAKASKLFGVIFSLHRPQRHNDGGETLMDGATINLYRYTNNKLKQVVHDLKLNEKFQYEDDDMERKLPKNTKKDCINIIENEKIGYHFVNTTNKELPDLILNKTIDKQWIQGRHLHRSPISVVDASICDSDYPTKVIKRSKAVKKTARLKFSNSKYYVPEDWRSGLLDKLGAE